MKIKTRTSGGFTLIELMVVVAIIGVFIGMATPSFINTINRNKVQDVIRGFEGALKTAKHTARSSGRQIDICPVDDITVDTPVCSNWVKFGDEDRPETLGWVVFRDTDRNNKISANEVIKKVAFKKSVVRVLSSNDGNITITPRGATFQNATLCIYILDKENKITKCNSDKAVSDKLKKTYGAKVVLSKLGAIRTEKLYK